MRDYTIHTSDEFENKYKIFLDKFGNIINHYYVSNNKIIIEYYHNTRHYDVRNFGIMLNIYKKDNK
jgi:hypothetical protein